MLSNYIQVIPMTRDALCRAFSLELISEETLAKKLTELEK